MQNPFLDKPVQQLNDFLLYNARSVGEEDPVRLRHPGTLQLLPTDGAARQRTEGGNIFITFSAFWFPYSGTEDRLQPIAVLLLVRCSKE